MNATTMAMVVMLCAVVCSCGVESSVTPPPDWSTGGDTDITTSTSTSTSATGGAGGAGGNSSGGATPCDPDKPTEAFKGYHGCWEIPCCTPGKANFDYSGECGVQSGWTETDAYLCAMEPTFGPQTDYRKCQVLDALEGQIECQWGASLILCCEPK